MDKERLLIEIGVEELPAIPLLRIEKEIENSWKKILKDNLLESDFEFFYTPRRLVISQEIPTKQPSTTKELFGPPVEIAIKDGEPTPAGAGFAKKAGVDFAQLEKKQKGNREILYFKEEIEGKKTKELLPEMIKAWVESMKFGKMMRWGDRSDEFIRPVRWLQVRLGDESVDSELFGAKSGEFTFLHRSFSFEPWKVENIDNFEQILATGGVTLNQKDRKKKILKEFEELEKELNINIDIDQNLLKEVVAITEHPKALVGRFDEDFLILPNEVIITSMKEHQRYFPTFKDGNLTNMFVVISNALTNDYSKVIRGNERVLRPRLSDAMFFYQNDLKRGLSTDGLEKIQFIDGLGSLLDKVDREEKIALKLANIYLPKLLEATQKDSSQIKELISRAVRLAKADLLTEMVYEFTELQGIIGYYYAKALGEDELVCNAIKEQYLPQGENGQLPSHIFSSIVALSIKLDTLFGLFSVGKVPTGSKDPFALRRAVNGIIRIVEEYELNFDIQEIILLIKEDYKEFDTKELESFIIERIYKSIKTNPSIIKAVLSSGERDILKIIHKSKALDKITSKNNFREIFSTFKRVANISKDVDLESDLIVDENLFESEQEVKLKKAFDEVQAKEYSSYEEKLEALFGLKETLDEFFDGVLVNVDDEQLKRNRLNLVGQIYKAFREIADIKEISI